jgi:DNA polymerase-3 subunit gamma/tau
VSERKPKRESPSASLYEPYKDALRRGHVAALRGRLEQAIDAYVEAASIASDRALPHAAIGGIFVRMGKMPEALAAYDRALELGPRDESSQRGRAEVLRSLRRPTEAAATLDRLAEILDQAGRLPEACDAARRALELAESKDRRRYVTSLAVRLRDSTGDEAAEQALAQVLRFLEPSETQRDAVGETDGATDDRASQAAIETREPAPAPKAATEPHPEAAAEPESKAAPLPEPEPELAPLPEPQPLSKPQLERRMQDPVLLGAMGEEALKVGANKAARTNLLAAAYAYRRTGRPLSAIDACFLAMEVVPADVDVHMMLAELYLESGWRPLAIEKLVLLSRLAELDDDPTTRERVCRIARERLADEPRLAILCA